ncbi:hypothetical protein P935_02065, partial [Mycobacterium tuberculosis KT-0039]
RSSGGYLLDEPPDMTPSFPRTGVSGHAGAVQEEVRIAVGYRWDPDTREIGAPLLSLRDGKDHVIWVVELDEPAAGVKITWTPIEPTLPSIDFGDLGEDSGASGER